MSFPVNSAAIVSKNVIGSHVEETASAYLPGFVGFRSDAFDVVHGHVEIGEG